MRRSVGIAALVAAAFGCAAGCSFLVDSTGLSPDASANVPPDAALVTGDGASVLDDGDATGVGTDANAPEDAVASHDGGAAPTVGCGAYADASFCVDFEGANPLASSMWTDVNGGITLTTASAISPTHAAQIDLANGAPPCTFVRLTRQFSGTWTSVRARASINASRDSIPSRGRSISRARSTTTSSGSSTPTRS